MNEESSQHEIRSEYREEVARLKVESELDLVRVNSIAYKLGLNPEYASVQEAQGAILTAINDRGLERVGDGVRIRDLRRALLIAMNTVECASVDPVTKEELPWYANAKKLVGTPQNPRYEGLNI